MLTELYSFLEALERNVFPRLFQFIEAAHIPWLVVPLIHLQTQQQWTES